MVLWRHRSRFTGGAFAAPDCLLALLFVACAGTQQPIFDSVASERPVANDNAAAAAAAPAPLGPGPAPASDLDPNVNFAWTETLPGQGTCRPGVYSGVFSCELKDGNLVTQLLSAMGTVTFTLGEPNEERRLPITNGSLGGPLFSGTLAGTLDCGTDALGAMSADGRAIQLDGLMRPSDVFVSFPSFTARLDGTLDRTTLEIEGEFIMVNDDGQTCAGTFTASASP